MNREGVIKFCAQHKAGVACRDVDIIELEIWRKELRFRGLVGQSATRYGGLGYGNLSKRMISGTFLITGSQTGHLKDLTSEEYARITGFDPVRNLVRSTGMIEPSSETMSHLAVYRSAPRAFYVFHTHCQEIWSVKEELGIPTTSRGIECGTVELFYELQRLLENRENVRKGILAMGGHQDGIITWGATAKEAGTTLLSLLLELQGQTV
jgi:L-ribulose-5-phosphate 4-epimerase